MKIKLQLLLWIASCVVHAMADAQVSQFFRLAGPAGSEIVNFGADGSLVWSNGQAGATYVVQTSFSLSSGNSTDYVQLAPTMGINTNLLVAFHPPLSFSCNS